ncbi:MAG: mannose-6-phosphate isomerase [Phycisphaerae bacterium]|nr:mannose-6-phosphate isomerase [Phycisphaerae bacterium]
MDLPPLRFDPILKHRAWGGDRLARWGREFDSAESIGESWDLADLPPGIPDGISRVAEGPLQGRTIADLREESPDALLGRLPVAATGGFPLLVKLLDAESDLSVQVHPDPAYAAAHPDTFVKNEAWYVLEARPGAAVYRGIHPGVTPEGFLESLHAGRLLDCLVRIEVRPGDCVRLPSGICHALGAGVVVAEAQTPSDTTFRVWDWDRDDPDRPLHLEQAMACMRFGAAQEDGRPAVSRADEIPAVETDGVQVRRMCSTDDFTIDLIGLDGDRHEIRTSQEPTVVLATRGESAVVDARGRTARLAPGDIVLVPASCPSPEVRPAASSRKTEFLRIDLPATSPRTLA